MKTRCKLRYKELNHILTYKQEVFRGLSKLNDLDRSKMRYGEDEKPDQDLRLVTCDLSSLI